MKEPLRGVAERGVWRAPGEESIDRVAIEEPLEIRLAGDPLAITMRTPGDDRELAIGFLFSEGVLRSIGDVGSASHCGRPGDEGYGNAIDVLPAPGVALDASALEGSRRGTLTTAACGVCGRRSIDDLIARIGVLDETVVIPRALIETAPEKLASMQARFERTGGTHAAAAIAIDGRVLAHAEDVGRHNAVDKVIGRLLLERRVETREAVLLAVSGRASFEIVQKAAAARIPCIAAVSAPTTLSIDLAIRAKIALAGFVRDGRFNLYTGAERVR
jgi:FdhD protein